MRYPEGDPRGKELFSALEERAEQGMYDDAYLWMLIEYQSLYPESEHFDIFYAKYAMFHKNYGVALEHAGKAFGKRRISLEVWRLFADSCIALGRPEEALPFQGYCCNFYRQPLEISMPEALLKKNLGRLSLAMGRGNCAPLCECKMSYDGGEMSSSKTVFGAEFLPVGADEEGYSYWVGVYNESAGIGTRGKHLEREMKSGTAGFFEGDDVVYDIMRSKIAREVLVEPKGSPVALPIAAATAAAEKQRVDFSSGGETECGCLGQWEYSFFRVEKPTRISSEYPLVFGRPIPLQHNSKRKRLVLNILVDALSWHMFRRERFRYMPNMMDFFSKGIIFDQQFSVSEYTYPSLPSIETGLYPHHSQIFSERAAIEIDRKHLTISEQMKGLGYYCTNLMGGGHAIYNGATRGYDRLVTNFCDLSAYAGTERAIRQMEAFSECDQFIFLHFMEVHPWPAGSIPYPLETQVHLPLRERLARAGVGNASVRLPDAAVYQEANRRGLAHVDSGLKKLFDYITAHYDEDEYIVQLYSDHGVSIYDKVPDLLGDNQTGTAYMMRGTGVPKKGMVEELTSTVDIYPVLGKLAGFRGDARVDGNLPAVFGGTERDHVISYSLFPGQTYKLRIRTKVHEFYLESTELVNEDGTVDLSGAELSIRTRDGSRRPVTEPAVMNRFLELVKEYTKSFNNEGRQWRSMMESRPEWYGKEKKVSH